MRISEQIVNTKGRSTGFDYLRIILALSVVTWHTVLVCYGPAAERAYWAGPFRPIIFFIIPSFFALSGFLVAGSLARTRSIPVFLTLRAVRIFPALCFEVLISALIIGPLLTDFSLSAYVTDPVFRVYFLNVLGDIHFYLPGVFVHNPCDKVNEQLWTIPSELKCYIIISVLYMIGVTRKSTYALYSSIAISILFLYLDYPEMRSGSPPSGGLIVSCFVWGVFLYLNREKVYFNGGLCALSLGIAWLGMTWAPEAAYLVPLPIAYVTMYLGLQNPRKIGLVAAGDYSYGVYLYGFPIQQAIAYLLPIIGRIWYVNLAASLLVAGACAWLSWVWLEAPVLARKGKATRFVVSIFKSIGFERGTGMPNPKRLDQETATPAINPG